MRAANPDGILDHALAARIGGEIRPALDKALKTKVGSGAELASLSEFRTILSQHLGNSNSAYVEAETRRAIQRTLETANRTGSQFSSAASQARTGTLAALGETARDDTGTEARRGGERVAAAMVREAPLTVTGAIGFAKELGISPAYTTVGRYVGGSTSARAAKLARHGHKLAMESPEGIGKIGKSIQMPSCVERFGTRLCEKVERVKGIEPSSSAWKAVALPLSYTRIATVFGKLSSNRKYDRRNTPVSPCAAASAPAARLRPSGLRRAAFALRWLASRSAGGAKAGGGSRTRTYEG